MTRTMPETTPVTEMGVELTAAPDPRVSYAMLRFFDGTEVKIEFVNGKPIDGASLALRAASTGSTRTPEAARELLGDEDGLRELHLLYNHANDDGPQFTRWQMIGAINHGIRLARTPEAVQVEKLVEARSVLSDCAEFLSDIDGALALRCEAALQTLARSA